MQVTRRFSVWIVVLGLSLGLPLVSGCAQLQNEAVNVLDNAARQFVNDTLDALFDQFRVNNP